MASKIWKTFNFFESSAAAIPRDVTGSNNRRITSVCSGPRSFFVGLSDGSVFEISPEFQALATWSAHSSGPVTHISFVNDRQILLTVGETLITAPEVKIWSLVRGNGKIDLPKLQSSIHIDTPKIYPITCFSVLPDLLQFAVGFANGIIVLVRGDLVHDRGSKQRIIHESNEPITGMQFAPSHSSSILYVATPEKLMTIQTSGRGQTPPPRVLEADGCSLGCLSLDGVTGSVLIARDDAIYFYNQDGRGPCYAYEGTKTLIERYGAHVALLLPPQQVGTEPSGRGRGAHRDISYEITTLVLLDTDLHFIAHVENIQGGVKGLFQCCGKLHVLTSDNKVVKLEEKLLSQRLDLLFQRDLYQTALKLGSRSGFASHQINEIHFKYGEFLFSKGDFDAAMQQYVLAITAIEPSKVIRKFLDNQRVPNLIQFLEELHKHPSYVTAEHTTLLLNCYAKLKDIDKLEAFITSEDTMAFELNTVIAICRQAGYFTQALFVAQKNMDDDTILDILFGDMQRYDEGMEFMKTLDHSALHRNLMKWGTTLLQATPSETTDLFIEYFTGAFAPRQQPTQQPEQATKIAGLGFPGYTTFFNIGNPLSSTILSATSTEKQDVLSPESLRYEPKPLRSAFPSFVNHTSDFIRFLEAVIVEPTWANSKTEIYNTLLELYLNQPAQDTSDRGKARRSKAIDLLELTRASDDTSNFLLLSHLNDFKEGTTLVRDYQGLYYDIFKTWASIQETQEIINTVKRHGPQDPQLYLAALVYLTSLPKAIEGIGEELGLILELINREGLIAPLQVVQILSKSNVATVQSTRQYLSGNIEKERVEIQQNQNYIDRYRNDTSLKKNEIVDLEQNPTLFQPTRCSSCGVVLELPAIHFLCKHSFHQRCLNIGDGVECPACMPDNAAVLAIRKAQEETSHRHDLFETSLNSTPQNRFGIISDFFSRGVMRFQSPP